MAIAATASYHFKLNIIMLLNFSSQIFKRLGKVFAEDFMEQQHSFSDSTPRAGSDRLKTSEKSLLSALKLMSISQIISQKYGSGHFDLFKLKEKFNRRTYKESF